MTDVITPSRIISARVKGFCSDGSLPSDKIPLAGALSESHLITTIMRPRNIQRM